MARSQSLLSMVCNQEFVLTDVDGNSVSILTKHGMQHDETYHEWLTLGVSILTKHGMQQ